MSGGFSIKETMNDHDPSDPRNERNLDHIFVCTNCWQNCSEDRNEDMKYSEKHTRGSDNYCDECLNEIES